MYGNSRMWWTFTSMSLFSNDNPLWLTAVVDSVLQSFLGCDLSTTPGVSGWSNEEHSQVSKASFQIFLPTYPSTLFSSSVELLIPSFIFLPVSFFLRIWMSWISHCWIRLVAHWKGDFTYSISKCLPLCKIKQLEMIFRTFPPFHSQL